MKTFVVPLLIWLFLLPDWATAQTSKYDPDTRTLAIDCVEFHAGGEPARRTDGLPQRYAVEMLFQNGRFSLAGARALNEAGDCSGRFNRDTGRYTDIVRIGDDAFDVILEIESDNTLSHVSHTYREPADTSLWRVTDGEREVFIGGAVHILSSHDYPLPESYETAYRNSDVVVLEIDVTDQSEFTIEKLVERAVRKDGVTLRERLEPLTYFMLEDQLFQWGIPISAVENWHVPFVADLLVEIGLELLGYGLDGVDTAYGRRAKADGRPIMALETVDFQAELISGLYQGLENELILNRLDVIQTGRLETIIKEDVRAWREGDLNSILENDIIPLQSSSPADYESLLAGRNRDWMPRILEMFLTDEVELVLVGVAHLPGQDGILTMLEEAGFSVEYYKP